MQGNKKIVYAIFIAVIIICGICYSLFGFNDREDVNITAEEVPQGEPEIEENQISKDIYIQMCGAVKNQGVYKVPLGTRIFEIIEMAGGLTPDVAIEAVNQARVARDGEQIYFPTQDEVIKGDFAIEGSTALININTASKEQLMTLPGIGESKALSIIQYRESGSGFSSIEDIKKVNGIKEAMFENIKDLITI